MTRRLSRRQIERWFHLRFQILINEGFTPEEANIVANARISKYNVRKFRAKRVRMLENAFKELSKEKGAVSAKEVKDYLAMRIRDTDEEVFDWIAYRRLVYGGKGV